MRATVERHISSRPASPRLLPVIVRVCAGDTSLSIRISDQGGGIPEGFASKVWAYGFTTSDMGAAPLDSGADDTNIGGVSGGGAGSGGDGSSQSAGSGASGSEGGSSGSGGEGSTGGSQSPGRAAAGLGGVQGSVQGGIGGAQGSGFGLQLQHTTEAPRQRYKLAGLGFGLPLSRLFARYFGGELALQNMPGYGVDAFLTLKNLVHLSDEWNERDHA